MRLLGRTVRTGAGGTPGRSAQEQGTVGSPLDTTNTGSDRRQGRLHAVEGEQASVCLAAGMSACMPCSVAVCPRSRSVVSAHRNGRIGVTVTDRWTPLVPAACGARVARPARTTMLAPGGDGSQLGRRMRLSAATAASLARAKGLAAGRLGIVLCQGHPTNLRELFIDRVEWKDGWHRSTAARSHLDRRSRLAHSGKPRTRLTARTGYERRMAENGGGGTGGGRLD
jgi:hypothetical protein